MEAELTHVSLQQGGLLPSQKRLSFLGARAWQGGSSEVCRTNGWGPGRPARLPESRARCIRPFRAEKKAVRRARRISKHTLNGKEKVAFRWEVWVRHQATADLFL